MNALSIVETLLRAVGLGGLADQIQADLADGKISVQEGVALAEAVTLQAEKYFPAQSPELQLAHDVAAAVDAYMKAKAKASAPPVGTGGTPGGAAGGPGGKPLA
jgi:hypothetical protein